VNPKEHFMSLLHIQLRRLSLALGLLIVLMAIACANPLRVPASEPLSAHMHDHFTMALRARDGVIAGNLAQSQNPLIWLNQHTYDGELPAAWKPYVQQMQIAARDAIYAESLHDTAQAVAQLASRCGACHRALGRGPKVAGQVPLTATPVDPRRRPDSLRPRMHQHEWAAQRLWEGLIGPSDAAWSDGSNALRELQVERTLSPSVRTELAAIRVLGQPLGGAEDRSQRYGEVIAACGGCHGPFGVGP
jgi:cytochrome c553